MSAKNAPKVDIESTINIYRSVERAIKDECVASVHGCYRGGLGVALAQMAFAGGLGMDVDLSKVRTDGLNDNSDILYSEIRKQFVVTIAPEDKEKFELTMGNNIYSCIGTVSDNDKFLVKKDLTKMYWLMKAFSELKSAYKGTFAGF